MTTFAQRVKVDDPPYVVYKDPDALEDYGFDWSVELEGDAIQTSTWSGFDMVLTDDHDTVEGFVTAVWLAGGTLDTTTPIRNTVTTSGGRTAVRTLYVTVVKK